MITGSIGIDGGRYYPDARFRMHTDWQYPYMDLPDLKFEVSPIEPGNNLHIRHRLDERHLSNDKFIQQARWRMRDEMACRLVANFDKDPSVIRLDERLYWDGAPFLELIATVGKVTTMNPYQYKYDDDYLPATFVGGENYERNTETIREYWEKII